MSSIKFPPADINKVIANSKHNAKMRLEIDKKRTMQVTENKNANDEATTSDNHEKKPPPESRKKELTPQQLASALRQMKAASRFHPSFTPKPSDLNRELTASEIEDLKRMADTI